ncbi:MAG TPA: DUF2269 domain-containing protein [Propionibacteriaceae bacterium]|nr:DUF2269 domain-containing protein [Propionibacteriaceae bacterium]
MQGAPGVRKLALTVHVIASVGWFGAAAAFLALAIAGLGSQSTDRVQALYLAMKLVCFFVIIPLSLASFVSGLVCALSSPWGLFEHYWVVFKLGLNLAATTVLLLYSQSLGYLADLARNGNLTSADVAQLRDPTHLVHSVGALIILTLTTILAVYKPRGKTRYGRRKTLTRAGSG